jgi:23S rRNA maturation-related 3'-5' exoribonuclease YhaM
MNTLFMAKDTTKRQAVVGMVYAANILQAQALFLNGLENDVLQAGIIIHDTGASKDSPEAKLLIAIFGNDDE